MNITSIQEYTRGKVLVLLDGHLEISLYKQEAGRLHLEEGAELPKGAYEEIMQEILPKRAKLRAMNLLQKRSYTQFGIRRKLEEGKYPEEIIQDTLLYLAGYGYLDDMRYAEEYIRCYCENRSKRRIMQELGLKGIDCETAQAAWEQHERLNSPVDEKAQIMELLCKRGYTSETADRKETARVMNYLYRKGYSTDSILSCVHFEGPR